VGEKISVIEEKAILAHKFVLRIYQWEQCCQEQALRKHEPSPEILVYESISHQS